nr:zinc finger BED domain-containing protein RICESLEEPER 2-like [Ipomoea batatas]
MVTSLNPLRKIVHLSLLSGMHQSRTENHLPVPVLSSPSAAEKMKSTERKFNGAERRSCPKKANAIACLATAFHFESFNTIGNAVDFLAFIDENRKTLGTLENLPSYTTAAKRPLQFCANMFALALEKYDCPISVDASPRPLKPEDRRRSLLDFVILQADVGSLPWWHPLQRSFPSPPKQGVVRYPAIHKFCYVEFALKDMFEGPKGVEMTKKVKDVVYELFNAYKPSNDNLSSTSTPTSSSNIGECQARMKKRMQEKFVRHKLQSVSHLRETEGNEFDEDTLDGEGNEGDMTDHTPGRT